MHPGYMDANAGLFFTLLIIVLKRYEIYVAAY